MDGVKAINVFLSTKSSVSSSATSSAEAQASADASSSLESSSVSSGPIESGDVVASESSSSAALPVEVLSEAGLITIGNVEAPLTLTVFLNAQSPYSRQFLLEHLPRLQSDFIDTSKLKLQIGLLDITKYEHSADDALRVRCAAEQNHGLDFLVALTGASKRTDAGLLALAKKLELTTKSWSACQADTAKINEVRQQLDQRKQDGITLVPTLELNGEKQTGLPYYPDLRGWIESKL
jgi:protein-disulfide isomerase